MSVRLESEIAKLKSAGVSLADLTAGELCELVRACDRCDNPFGAVNAEAAGFPIKVRDGVFLWRLTAGAIVWLDEYAARWWGEDTAAYKWATVYAMRHARDAAAFHTLTDEADAYRAIRADLLTLNCTEEEIDAALARFNDDGGDKRRPPVTAPDWRALAAMVEARTGIKAEEWIWGRAALSLADSYNRLCQFAAAEGVAKPPRMKDELDKAIIRLARVVAGILARATKAKERSE